MTIAQQLKITTFPFEIKDENGRPIYREFISGYWWKCEYDQDGNEIYHEKSNGWWVKREYDQDGNEIYTEDSNGYIRDNRPKPEPEPKRETLEEAVERYEKTRVAHDELYVESNDIEDLKESYYYKGRRDECIKWQAEQFKNKGGDK
jgi:hypothetical protein